MIYCKSRIRSLESIITSPRKSLGSPGAHANKIHGQIMISTDIPHAATPSGQFQFICLNSENIPLTESLSGSFEHIRNPKISTSSIP